MQQFATRVYGPLFTAGLHFWQLGESHYWGHNAIIRMQPFIDHRAPGAVAGQGLVRRRDPVPRLVEAALMRRAGWGVWIATTSTAATKNCRRTCSTNSSATAAGATAT